MPCGLEAVKWASSPRFWTRANNVHYVRCACACDQCMTCSHGLADPALVSPEARHCESGAVEVGGLFLLSQWALTPLLLCPVAVGTQQDIWWYCSRSFAGTSEGGLPGFPRLWTVNTLSPASCEFKLGAGAGCSPFLPLSQPCRGWRLPMSAVLVLLKSSLFYHFLCS